MNFSEIKELVELFEAGSIRELDLKQGDLALYLNKNETNRQVAQAPVATKEVVVEAPQAVEETTPAAPAVETKVETVAEGEAITSPIVGVVYTANDPASPAFVNVGDTVKVGDTLCIIEAMKIMNEIKSDVAGVVTEVLIKNEDVVEFGQTLFRVK